MRLLGGGSEGLPDLAAANGLERPGTSELPPWLTVGFDVLGGRFAVNGGGLPGQPGEVCYWGPDTLAWTALGGGYSQFARMVLSGGLAGPCRSPNCSACMLRPSARSAGCRQVLPSASLSPAAREARIPRAEPRTTSRAPLAGVPPGS